MKLSQLSGVGLVSIAGNQRPAIRVQLNPSQVAALGLSFDSIRTLINDNNLSMSKGSLQGPYRSSTIDANDQLKTPDDYRALIVAYQNGNAIRLGDIASVVEEAQNQYLSAWLNEQPAILLNIQRQPNANVIAVVRADISTVVIFHREFTVMLVIAPFSSKTAVSCANGKLLIAGESPEDVAHPVADQFCAPAKFQ
jgi:multidrug efflux pump subunit AcrB